MDERDLAELCLMYKDPRVMATLGGVRSDDETRKYLADNTDHWKRYGFGVWALRHRDGGFAGRAGIRHLDLDGADEVELLYSFMPEFWGAGMATEISEALLDIGFGKHGLQNIVAYTLTDHRASRRVMEKVGFQLESERDIKGYACALYRLQAAAFRKPV